MASRAQPIPRYERPEPAVIHPDVDLVLGGQPVPIAQAAARAIAAALRERTSGGIVDVGGSRLTGDGFPVEFAVAHDDTRLRVTIEPGARTLPPAQRTALAAALFEEIGGKPLARETLAQLHAIQQGATLRYGAWIGCCCSDDGSVAIKLYAEAPADAPPPVWPALGAREMQMRMIGCTADGAREVYWRIPSLMPSELRGILAPAGLEEEADGLLDWIAGAYGHALTGRLPGTAIGISYACAGDRTSVTLFITARALWGSDARIRVSFAQIAGTGPQVDRYITATRAFAQAREWRTRHGMLAITPRRGRSPGLVLGYRPVAP